MSVSKLAAAAVANRPCNRRDIPAVQAAQTGWDPLSIWTPGQASARIDQIDAKVQMIGSDIEAAAVAKPELADFLAHWNTWRHGWDQYAAELRDSFLLRGWVNTANQLDAYDRELDVWVDRFKSLGNTPTIEIPSAVSRPKDPNPLPELPTSAGALAIAVLSGAVGAALLLFLGARAVGPKPA